MTSNADRLTVAVDTLSVYGPELGGGFVFLTSVLPSLADNMPNARFFLIGTKRNESFFTETLDRRNVEFIPVSRVHERSVLRNLYVRYFLSERLAELNVDVFFQPYGPLPLGLNCPSVWGFQNLYFLHSAAFSHWSPGSTTGKAYERIRLKILSRSHRTDAERSTIVVAPSTTAANEISSHWNIDRNKIHIAPLAVDSSFTFENNNTDSHILKQYGLEGSFVLTVGALAPNKNLPSLIAAFAEARKQITGELQLVLVGSDWWNFSGQLKSIVESNEVSESVRFVGHVPHQLLPAFYRRALLTAITSGCESFCLPALEAMACGSPLIAANASGLAETAGDGALLVSPDNKHDLSEAIVELATDRKQRELLSARGIARASCFHWVDTARALEQAILTAAFGLKGASKPGNRIVIKARNNRVAEKRLTINPVPGFVDPEPIEVNRPSEVAMPAGD